MSRIFHDKAIRNHGIDYAGYSGPCLLWGIKSSRLLYRISLPVPSVSGNVKKANIFSCFWINDDWVIWCHVVSLGHSELALCYLWKTKNKKTHHNSLWPSDAIWWHRSGLTLAQVMMAPSQCWLGFIETLLWPIPQEVPKMSFHTMSLKYTLVKLLPHPP